MTSLLSRALATLRVWIGMNDPAGNDLHPTPGWLLPPSADHARELEFARAASPAPGPSGTRRAR
jgi:hypothetical protein